MVLQAPGTDIHLGYGRRSGPLAPATTDRLSSGAGGDSVGTFGGDAEARAASKEAVGWEGTERWHPLLQDPADVKVTVTTVSPSGGCGGGGGGGVGGAGDAPLPLDALENALLAAKDGDGGVKGGGEGGGGSVDGGDGSDGGSGARRSHGEGCRPTGTVDTCSRGDGGGGVGVAVTSANGSVDSSGSREVSSSGGLLGGIGGLDALPEEAAQGTDSPSGETDSSKEGGEERIMRVRVELPRLSLSLTPDARAALSGCVGKNILAGGFHGENSENFPLMHDARGAGNDNNDDGNDEDYEDDVGSGLGRSGRSPQLSPRLSAAGGFVGGSGADGERPPFVSTPPPPSPPPSSSGTVFGSRGDEGAAAVACAACAASFDELVARHQCAWCCRSVCRRCMHNQVPGTGVTAVSFCGMCSCMHVLLCSGFRVGAKTKSNVTYPNELNVTHRKRDEHEKTELI